MIELLEEMKQTLRELQGVVRWHHESPQERDSKDALTAFAGVIVYHIDDMIASKCIQHPKLKSCICALETISDLINEPGVDQHIRALNTIQARMAGCTKL